MPRTFVSSAWFHVDGSGAVHVDGPADTAGADAPSNAGGAGGSAHHEGPQTLRYEHDTMQHLVQGSGYPLEEHFVTTEDGYVLGCYRIPHGRAMDGGSSTQLNPRGRRYERNRHVETGGSGSSGSTRRPSCDGRGSSRHLGGGCGDSSASRQPDGSSGSPGGSRPRPPVLLQHGLLDSSAAWVLNEPSQSLAFILADAGYDVWMGNSRGNLFSRNHTGLDPSGAEFWDFCFDDMADHDVPAVVGYILGQTGAPSLAYVGHSQGTTVMFAALASSPALRDRLSVAIMLAPAVHMRGIHALPMQVLAAMDADRLFTVFGVHEFLPTSKAAADLFGELCRATPLACASIITAIAGFNADNMNLTRLPTMVQYAPSGTSVKNIAHWAQAIRESREYAQPLFQRYDYGNVCFTPAGLPRTCNMRVYHSLEPPSYDLGAISSPPLALFFGGQDRLADPADVRTLLEALPQDVVVYRQYEPTYEHIDFTWGIDARQRIYPAVLQLLRRFSEA